MWIKYSIISSTKNYIIWYKITFLSGSNVSMLLLPYAEGKLKKG